jgi:uncharacterized protein
MADWDRIQQRGRVEDRRGRPAVAVGGASLGMLALVVIFSLVTGTDPTPILEGISPDARSNARPVGTEDPQYSGLDDYELYVAQVTGSADMMWEEEFREAGLEYRPPQTVLFRQATESGCGGAHSQTGPHYCPADETIYLDETFFDELTTRYGARGGEVAQAYVLAHEVGHHVQTLLGANRRVTSNEASIALELQADCYAGVWAKYVEDADVITVEEVDQAIDAAAAVGDDRIQQRTTGRINPESWTHGSSAQRKQWFLTGFNSGDPDQCEVR